jgi:hypothetical protein
VLIEEVRDELRDLVAAGGDIAALRPEAVRGVLDADEGGFDADGPEGFVEQFRLADRDEGVFFTMNDEEGRVIR